VHYGPLFVFTGIVSQDLKMQPTIIVKQRVPGMSKRELTKFIADACRATRLRGMVTVMLTDNREIRALNLRFKGKDRATDVLSFPAPIFVRGFAGDIVISAEIAAKNARALGHSVSDEVRILVLHALLHLAGYDHDSDHGEMARREQLMRKRLQLPGGLIERSTSVSSERRRPKSNARSARART
jgi:probable rRNA maturation factor